MAGSLESKISNLQNQGLEPLVITLLSSSTQYEPIDWIQSFSLSNVWVDEGQFTQGFLPFSPSGGSFGTPFLVVIDAVTMEIVASGNYGTSWPAVVQNTAQANAN